MDEILREFLAETAESLALLDVELVSFERCPEDAGILMDIFRVMHTIKGTCGFLGLSRLEKLAHAGEDVLGKFRDGNLAVTPEAVGAILQCIDRIRDILAAIENTGEEDDTDDGPLIAGLKTIADGQTAAPRPDAAEAREPKLPAVQQSIRVSVALLENLMALVSELDLTRNTLLQLVRDRSDSEFTEPLQRLSAITTELREGVMKARMQPIGSAWAALPRIIRDLSVDTGKRLDLRMIGGETEVDRQILQVIKDPLTHMVRNSADHGIEPPHERLAAGKPEVGTLTLRAFQRGGHIIIEVADDGRGLDTQRIRCKALASGLATEAELEAMSEDRIHQFIMHAGFTTVEAVTSVSGRGVGMDVVRTSIEKLGGTIALKSVAGQGTTFTIKLPDPRGIATAMGRCERSPAIRSAHPGSRTAIAVPPVARPA